MRAEAGVTRVVYVAGWGRSGTTVFANVLGSVPGFVSIGEVRSLWDRNLRDGIPCGCGAEFATCPFWSRARDAAFSASGWPDRDGVQQAIAATRTRGFPRLLVPWSRRRAIDSMRGELRVLAALYRGMCDAAEGATLVDTSKVPSYGWLLSRLEGVELHSVLMVRDPRAVAYSWAHPKLDRRAQGVVPMSRHGFVASAALWTTWELAARRLLERASCSFRVVRYEDFVRSPKEVLASLVQDLGGDIAELPFLDEHTVLLKPSHTCSGNPVRFTSGPLSIAPDDRWRGELSGLQRTAIALLTRRGMNRYGYRRDRHGR
jgi:hypothetical protein